MGWSKVVRELGETDVVKWREEEEHSRVLTIPQKGMQVGRSWLNGCKSIKKDSLQKCWHGQHTGQGSIFIR